MRSKSEIISLLVDPGIIAVVRAPRKELILPLSEALIQGGVIAVEVTMTTPHAIEAIAETKRALGKRGLIGVGTVLNAETCRQATNAGAEFVVSPITSREIVEAAHAAERPVMLGAYTPTEAQSAHEMGADFVKLFPADGLGPGYVKALRAPLPHLRIVPTGGVDLKTAADFIQAGCAALGVGSSLVSTKLLEAGDWAELTRLAKEYVAIVRAARQKK
jgi:2-dehydro-3-deoxyphosphogluconate aldolase / (4S)-4-hydroxy-2-oxoglutarate aldolase